MKTLKVVSVAVLAIVFTLGLNGPIAVLAATTPSLGAAASYGVLASTYTNTSAGTTINGDVGFTTGPAVAPAGTHTNYGSGAPYATAGTNQGSALSALASQACTFTFAPGAINLSTDTTHGAIGVYAPGVYCSTGAMNIGGPLSLSGSGTFIFRTDGALNSTAGAIVSVTNGASACDVFWTPSAATTLAANTTMLGTLIGNAGVTIGANTNWLGRSLAFGGTVTTDTDTITVPTCAVAPVLATLHIIKQVVNNNGGTTAISSFNLHVKLSGTDVTGSPAVGTATPGTSYSLSAGTYVVSEDANASYTKSFSGDCNSSGSVTLAAGDNKTCTITNDDIASALIITATSTIKVIKTVINDNGRTMTVADFPLFVDGTSVVSGVAKAFSAGVYAVTETTNSNYTQSFSGDCNSSGSVTLAAGDNKVCTITNNDIAVNDIVEPVVAPPTAVPTLPNTGIAPDNSFAPWNIVIPAGMFVILLAFYVARKKQLI